MSKHYRLEKVTLFSVFTFLLSASLVATGGAWQAYEYTSAQHAQIRQVVAAHNAADLPQDLHDKLNHMRNDLHDLYFSIPRVSLPFIQDFKKLPLNQQAALHAERARVEQKYQSQIKPSIARLCQKHGVDLLQDQHSLSFRIRTTCGWWVLKMRKLGYPMPFQNLSRLFYVHNIQQLIHDNKYDAIMPPQAYAYNVHGINDYDPRRRECAFNDDNWWVIEPYILGLPSPRKNRKRFLQLSKKHPGVLSQLHALIGQAGLWDIKDHNLFLLTDRSAPLVVFADLEMPGIGGARPEFFFHRRPEEIISNGNVGKKLLAQLITPLKKDNKKTLQSTIAGAIIVLSLIAVYRTH